MMFVSEHSGITFEIQKMALVKLLDMFKLLRGKTTRMSRRCWRQNSENLLWVGTLAPNTRVFYTQFSRVRVLEHPSSCQMTTTYFYPSKWFRVV